MKRFILFWVKHTLLGQILRSIFGENFVEEKPLIANVVGVFILLILFLALIGLWSSLLE
ncbi:hypothetical protein PSHI8_10600 [Polynucleobacter sp. SHI8]|uniref:hypothetical protein n=1 Tax=unclassified Polynucleobacter TaxID=2640945 RepID=UPI002491E671|nr:MULTISPECIES: hypothetical protein [unclassified Polynucleobacter]BDW10978.1 hypothetical protein PSHI2_10600 [Polynucleobacter sp. SHI2]BDW13424.1 hypothetical protein PSHI8_10600 [Polynucleobacter sp. SHI8]